MVRATTDASNPQNLRYDISNTQEMQLSLPWPPSVNNYWRMARGRIYISAKGRAYREAVKLLVHGKGHFNPDTRLDVHITANPPDRRRRDVDNLFKCTLDSLEHANIFADDSQVDRLSIHRAVVIPGGALLVTIQSVSNEE